MSCFTAGKIVGTIQVNKNAGNKISWDKLRRNHSGSQTGLRSLSRKDSEVFGWSRIPDNTGSRSRIFLSNSGSPIGSFSHRWFSTAGPKTGAGPSRFFAGP